jgi:catechol 2,3-dioxygenase-like lactoylglutathione lyase family enzyme
MAAVAQHLARPEPRLRGLDHVVVPVSAYRAAKRFYERALRPLGFAVLLDWPDRARTYLGVEPELSSLWLEEAPAAARVRLALAAPSREAVDGFYAAALASGGHAVEEPGPRPEYSARAYGAAVRDADGNVIEALSRSS